MFTDDPVLDAERYSAEQDRQLARLPKCSRCGNPIQQDHVVCIGGKLYCDECLDDFTHDIEDFMR